MRAAAHERRDEKSPLALRIVHALVFLGLASAAMALGNDELRQLRFAWRSTFHFGHPPAVLPIIGAGLGAAGALLILVHFARGRSVPLWASMLPLFGVALGYAGRVNEPPRRTHFAANLDVLAAARQLHRLQLEKLQTQAIIPVEKGDWEAALAALQLPKSPARDRAFQLLPFQIAMLQARGADPTGAPPGTIGVWVSPDGAEFELRAVGFDANKAVAPLRDDAGQAIVLMGTYNPELKDSAPERPRKVAPSPWDLPPKE